MKSEPNTFQQKVMSAIAESRDALLRHQLYDRLETLEQLNRFMELHVFAVWDFMSLLKALQARLTCVQTPWLPPVNQETCRLVNEIVLGEESDRLPEGGSASHFELYRRAMQETGADTTRIDSFIGALRAGQPVAMAMDRCDAPAVVQAFVGHTFTLVDKCQPHEIAAAFTFGREDLIPDMFTRLVHGLERQFPGRLQTLRYYLDRHIELDGDEHGAMGLRMVNLLCAGDSKREEEAIHAAVAALQVRLKLWDGIAESISAQP